MNFTREQLDQLAGALAQSITSSFSNLVVDKAQLEKLPKEIIERKEKAARDSRIAADFKRFLTEPGFADAHKMSYLDAVDALIRWKDQISFEEVRHLIPAVMSEVVTEAMEPEAIGTRLLPTIPMPDALNIEFPMVGAIADAEEVGPGNEYPIRKFAFASQGIVRMGKYGLRMEVQEEVIKFVKGWDIFGMMLRACGRAMIRPKEKRIFAHILASGVTYFDNVDTNVLNTSGIGPTGAQNGSFTLDDLVSMAGDLINNGFIPDVLIINGMCWSVFARTPELREMALASGNGPLFQWPQGNAGIHPQGQRNPLGAAWTTAPALATTYTNPDSSLLGRSFRTAVSPYVPYTAASGSTPALGNIILADSRYLGVILQQEGVTTDEFNDPRIDVKSVKFKERYAIGALAEGLGVRVARNVALTRGFDPLTAFTVQLAAGSVTFPGAKGAVTYTP